MLAHPRLLQPLPRVAMHGRPCGYLIMLTIELPSTYSNLCKILLVGQLSCGRLHTMVANFRGAGQLVAHYAQHTKHTQFRPNLQ